MRHISSSSSFLFGYRENYIGLGFDAGGKVETLPERLRERETQSKSFSELTRASLNSRPGYIFGF